MSYSPEWTAGPIFLGTVFLFLIVPPFALIALGVVALALAGSVLALPFLLVRSLHRHLAERHRSTQAAGSIATAIAETGQAARQRVALLATEHRS